MILKTKYLSVELCRKHPDIIFVFGDNVQRWGKKGQAVIRNEPNSFGLVTKWEPKLNKESFFTDSEECKDEILVDLHKLVSLIRQGKTICLPEDGLGTGLSRLPTKAPKLYSWLESELNKIYTNRR